MHHRSFIYLAFWSFLAVRLAAATVLFDETAAWRYMKGTAEASSPDTTAWRQRTFDDGAWSSGAGPFYYEVGTGYSGNTVLPDMNGGYSTLYLRHSFGTGTPTAPAELILDVRVDDGCVVWINGVEVARVNMPAGEIPFNGVSLPSAGDPNIAGLRIPTAGLSLLSEGNVLAIQAANAALSGSSDFLIAAALSYDADLVAPVVDSTAPSAGATVRLLPLTEVVFSEGVQGVDATDLLVNGSPAAELTVVSPRDYIFKFPQPAPGPVSFSWAAGNGISDLASPSNAFAGGGWTCTLDTNLPAPVVLISEFMADNADGIRDEDGERSDWVELHNPAAETVTLTGWFLSDDAGKPAKWRFPSVTLPPGGYLLLWASGKDRTNAAAALHTNFKLSPGGEYLGLADPLTNVVCRYSPVFPPQQPDISYGLDAADPTTAGYFPNPTPGSMNQPGGPGFAPDVTASLAPGVYNTNPLRVSLAAVSGTIRFTTDGTAPTASSSAYQGTLSFTRSTVVKARVFEPGLLPGRIFTATYHIAAGSAANFSSKLPILILNTSGAGVPQDSRVPAFVTAIDTFRGRARISDAPQFQGMGQMEVRGQSSSGFPKVSYNLELSSPYNPTNDLKAPLLGLPSESDWVLYAPYTDKALVNNFLAYELHEQMGHYAVRRRFVEVFLDQSSGLLEYPGDYVGIYLLVEKIKLSDNRVDLTRLTPAQNSEPEISGGYIIKKDKDSPGDLGFYTTGGAGGFTDQYLKIHEPKPREITTPQYNWIRNYMVDFERSLYATNWLTATGAQHYSSFIDVDSFVDNHWIVEFAKQIDGYRLSNYMSKDRNGKLRMEPIWDWNLSFGNADYLEGWDPAGWYYPLIDQNQHIYLRRLICGTTSGTGTTGDPEFKQRLIDRWSVLRTNILNGTRVTARMDELATLLSEAQLREFQRWPRLGTYIWPNPQMYVTPTTYAAILTAMRGWILQRFNWIDAQFPRVPEVDAADGYVTPGFALTLSAPMGAIYYTRDGSDPRLAGGAVSPAALLASAPLVIDRNVRLAARARNGATWGGPMSGTWLTEPSPLRITELMFGPAATAMGDTNDPAGFEFIELRNTGASPLALDGYAFTAGVAFSFATGSVATLAPGEHVLVVRNAAGFAQRYPGAGPVAGEYVGTLANEGERLTLTGPQRQMIQSFTYQPDRFPAAQGLGFSLVAMDPTQPWALGDRPEDWRLSSVVGGSPGAVDPDPGTAIPGILINEVLTHTDPPQKDFIELFNPTLAAVDVSGWFLSDDPATPKYRIPSGTPPIPAGGFRVFTQDDYDPVPAGTNAFDLRSAGDEAYLFSASAAGQLTGYRQGFSFGAALNGSAFGRWVDSAGTEHFLTVQTPTPGASNAPVLVGPVVISEVQYHPPDIIANGAAWDDTEDEFVELHNVSGAAVPLYDPNAPTNTWRLRDAVRFAFPTNESLAAGERVLVVSFDPTNAAATTAFRTHYQLDAGVRLFGPWDGKLANGSDSVELVRPDLVRFYTTNEIITSVLVDKVAYQDETPWPAGADGLGFSLQRNPESVPGVDPASWVAGPPSPGAAYQASTRPDLLEQPAGLTVFQGGAATFHVTASGSGLQYQWRRNGDAITNGTLDTLTLTNVQPADAGRYQVVVWAEGEPVASAVAELAVVQPAVIFSQPQSQSVAAGATVVFSASAWSASPMRYQWQREGAAIAGATLPTLTVGNAMPPQAGVYRLVIANASGSVTSAPAVLSIAANRIIVQSPVDQRVPQGGTATFSVEVLSSTDLPIGYAWTKDGQPVASHVGSSHVDFLTLTNLQAAQAGSYTVTVTNAAVPAPGDTSAAATLTVLQDLDGDGMPDEFEQTYGFNILLAADAAQDADGDGVSNRAEYLAGTDPKDPNSVLRVSLVEVSGAAEIQFVGAADRSFNLQYCESLPAAPWQVLTRIPATSSTAGQTRTVLVTDPDATHGRYYRVVSPGSNGP